MPDRIPVMDEIKNPPMKLNSSGGAGNGSVYISMPRDVGQNIGDRAIAHIESGGIGVWLLSILS